MHLAALIAIPYSYRSPAAYVDTNIMGTLNVVQAARELGVEKVIHTSTSETYGKDCGRIGWAERNKSGIPANLHPPLNKLICHFNAVGLIMHEHVEILLL